MSDVIVAPEQRDLGELAGILSDWLGEQLETQGVEIANLAYPRGAGQSHETILFDVRWAGGMFGAVLRIKPGHFTVFPDDLFEEQFRVMQLMHENGAVRVAEPLWLEEDASVLGRPFFIMRKVAGRVPVSVPPYAREGWVKEASPAQRRRMWEGGVRQLAAIQTVPVEAAPFLAGPEHARSGLAQEWDKYCRFVEWLEDGGAPAGYIDVLVKGLTRLNAARPANQPDGVVWGDARLGNMMFDDNFDVVAVMDWEQPSLGGALHDLAWFCEIAETMHGPNARHGAPLDGMGSRDETIALWEEVSGKSAADLEWYEAFARLKMSCTGVRLALLRGVAPQMSVEQMAARLRV